MTEFELVVGRYVTDVTRGDKYEDWKKILGDGLYDKYDVGHKLVYAIRARPHLYAFLSELDEVRGTPIDAFAKDFELYVSASVFVALSDLLVDAFYELDVNQNRDAFLEKIRECESTVSELLNRMCEPDYSIRFSITADPDTRLIEFYYAVSYAYVVGYGLEPYGELPYGSPKYPEYGYGVEPYGSFPWGNP